jgi:hypothetical protein
LILPTPLAERLEASGLDMYWRFMVQQLRRLGALDNLGRPYTTRSAWRAFRD